MISRNGPCPCGSEKQYKRCCGKDEKDKGNNKHPFSKYNTVDILQTFAAITLVPANHGKNLRLETLALEALKHYNTDKKHVSYDELKQFTRQKYPSDPMEDAPSNLFTEVIIFHGGDHIVLPGITESPSFTVNHLLPAIYNWPYATFSAQFKTNCHHVVLLLLNLADTVSKKAGLTRYLAGQPDEKPIFFPTNDDLATLKKAVFFSNEEIESLLSDNGIAKEALNVITAKVPVERIEAYEKYESPLFNTPIVKTGNGYIIASPASLCYALINFIKEAADNFNCTQELHKAYHEVVWNETLLNLQRLNFKKIDIPEVPLPDGGAIHSVYAQFDSDKIALIQYIPVSLPENTPGPKELRTERESIFKHILAIERFKNFQFMDLTIVSPLLNDMMFPMLGTSLSQTILVNTYEFDVLAKYKESSAIDLWKFSIAREQQVPKAFRIGLGFLDEYSIFKDHSDSFYLSDEGFDLSKWRYGVSQGLIEKTKLREDQHSMTLRVNGRLAKTSVTRMDSYSPIYASLMDLADGELQFAVEGFGTSVWVKPENQKRTTDFINHLNWEFTQTFSYWLWQICEEIKPYVNIVDANCVQFSFILQDENKFENLDETFKRDPDILSKFQLDFKGDTIRISIPVELMSFFYGADNEGDRILVRQVMLGLNLALASKGQQVITDEDIATIIEKRAPLGKKKKLILLHSRSNLLLDRRNLKKVRYIQDYDVSTTANALGSLLGKHLPPVGEITDIDEKKKLARDLVLKALLPHLKATIDQYNNERLIERLIALNESLIHNREDQKIKTPTRIACFVSEDEHTEDLMDTLEKISRTSIAVRCLLEHLAAEPATGSKSVNKCAVDELVAIMDAIISWGSLGDQLTFQMFDIRMGVLPTGRIGTQKTISREIFDPYYHSKTKETVKDAISSFDQEFPINDIEDKEDDVPEFLNKAFTEDFNISFSRICKFIDLLAGLGFEQATPFAAMDKKSLFEIAQKHGSFAIEEFNNAIKFLGLKHRGRVEDFSKEDGCEGYDISPWRFNRRLSLLRRPLIICDANNPDNPLIYWGPRQVLLSRITIAEQLHTDRFKVDEQGAVKKAMSKLTFERGAGLVVRILSNLKLKEVIIDSGVFISPTGKLKNAKDIGDVDVLLVDLTSKTLYSLECKSFAASRNIKEMIEEIEKLLGGKSTKGLIEKHSIRHDWISNNLKQIGEVYGVELSGFRIKSAFITRESMIFPFLQKVGVTMSFLTLYDLETEGYSALKTL